MPLSPSRRTSDATLSEMDAVATHLSSAGIREQWEERLKAHSVFSARTTSQKYIDMVKKRLAEVASRQISPQRAEEMLRRTLQDIGYRPETGFPDSRTGAVPPATPGDIRDLSSSRRIQLILDTNVKQARSLGQIAASEDPMMLMTLPAWRLTRTGARKKPRGDWKRRWEAAGAKCGWKGALRRQMIALKTSPIWQALADGAGGFTDTLGSPYPPFAFGSGLAWVNVGRREWKRMCAAEGVKDWLDDVTAKAKTLKKEQDGGVKAPVSAPPAGGMSTGSRASEGTEGVLGAFRDVLAREIGRTGATTPDTEPVRELFRADFTARTQANDEIDDALDDVRGVRDGAQKSVGEIADASKECGALAGDTPSSDMVRILTAMDGYARAADAATKEIASLFGRIVGYGRAVETTPVPRSVTEQAEFNAAMERYRTAAKRTAESAEAQSLRVARALAAARKALEMMRGMAEAK